MHFPGIEAGELQRVLGSEMASVVTVANNLVAGQHQSRFPMLAPKYKTLFAVAVVAVVASAPTFVPSAEDATILFQYSDHLAKTGAICYIAHGPHIEGATDFLWMVLLAFGRRIGVSPHAFTGPLNAMSLCGIAWFFADVTDVTFLDSLSWTSAVFLLCPQMVAALSGFNVLPFGFALILVFWAYYRRKSKLVPCSALFLCLLRPDGLVFALPLLVFDLVRQSLSGTAWRTQIAGFYFPALLYMIWRMSYFHQLFPLPFLVKSQAYRWMGLLVVVSLEDMSRYLSFGILTIALLWQWKAIRGTTLAIVVSGMVIPTLFYLTMRLDQNLADRFFFYLIIVPLFLLCLHKDHFAHWRIRDRVVAFIILIALFLWPYTFALIHLCTDRYLTNSLVARDINEKHLYGSLAVSEAGLLAYETGWPTTDVWGLNSPQFAKHVIQPADVPKLGADVIVLRYTTCRVSLGWPPPSHVRSWSNMSQNLLRGASIGGYEEYILPYNQRSLATSSERFTDGSQTYLCYFIRTSYASRQELQMILRSYGAKEIYSDAVSSKGRNRSSN
jgi:hypothetical protein